MVGGKGKLPGHITQPCSTSDYLPTILEMTGLSQQGLYELDGESFLPFLSSEKAMRKKPFSEIRPGMISGFMLALTLSIDDFAVTVFTIGNQGLETLSTYIYADARKGGLTPELRPLSAIIFVVVLALLIVINYRAGKTKKKES